VIGTIHASLLRRIAASLAALALLQVVVAPTGAYAQQLEIIDLQYRLATDLIPVLAPLLDAGGVLTGTDDKLFVRTSPANFAQIREAVARLDRAWVKARSRGATQRAFAARRPSAAGMYRSG
jgi:type II secretory pathway component GspD/PulD (secretin)